ncbi:protein FAM204A-like [Ornithodoros turicata]|uniref:protein FAM204A-like n=1 Tax=Ornithodoros turicata TaxID=34597 RepID=UPI00313A2C96
MTSDDDDDGLDLTEIDIFRFKRPAVRQPRGTIIEDKTNAVLAVPISSEQLECVKEAPGPSSIEERFQNVRKLASSLHERTLALDRRTEKRRLKRLEKKEAKLGSLNPDKTQPKEREVKGSWDDVRGYLNINEHLTGPTPQGRHGPKTELECMVDAAIAEGDFEKAEILSDNLSNSQFAVKIADAFAAKRYAEELKVEKAREYIKKQKKLPWGFEAKERWEMKGNM